MEVLDIVLLALFIPGIIMGLVKGLIVQVVSLLSVVVGAIVAGRFAPDLTQIAMMQLGSGERATYVICFILIFLAVALVMALVGKLITKLFKIATLGWFIRLLGALFSVFTTALLLGLLICAFEGLNASWEIVDPARFENCKVYPALRDFASAILPQARIFFEQWIAV
ncbi:MAG: CvpA family protein [Bacteroidales bacterium]|nr:CvpA family protein [Bacteroidales bacterium]